jgi:hypothetical protein
MHPLQDRRDNQEASVTQPLEAMKKSVVRVPETPPKPYLTLRDGEEYPPVSGIADPDWLSKPVLVHLDIPLATEAENELAKHPRWTPEILIRLGDRLGKHFESVASLVGRFDGGVWDGAISDGVVTLARKSPCAVRELLQEFNVNGIDRGCLNARWDFTSPVSGHLTDAEPAGDWPTV